MTTDKSLLENQINGLEARIKELRANKDIFTRAQGMDIEAAKLNSAVKEDEKAIAERKKFVKDKQHEKAVLLSPVIAGLSGTMAKFIPIGVPKIELPDDGKLFIGWIKEPGADAIPFPALSGGEQVMMKTALAKALGATIIAVEAAEVDDQALDKVLDAYLNSGVEQIIVSTCHPPATISKEWEVYQL